MSDRSDFATYVDARWPDLVGALEDEGVPGDRARLAVAEALLAARRSWERRVREEQVDVTLWAEVRDRADLPVGRASRCPTPYDRATPATGRGVARARGPAARRASSPGSAPRRDRPRARGRARCGVGVVGRAPGPAGGA
ncbi:hypothetical protein ACNKF0_10050 [Nocardioides sp. T5]|uniref:hypothetical protein n=1 Tax=Nocardioides sp. T5 TaxID=3400182 RepID=UPI003A869685